MLAQSRVPDRAADARNRGVAVPECREARPEAAAFRRRPAADIVETLYHSARTYAENTPQQDDITAVVLKVELQPRADGSEGVGI